MIRNSLFAKLTSALLAFLFFIAPLAPVFAAEDSGLAPATEVSVPPEDAKSSGSSPAVEADSPALSLPAAEKDPAEPNINAASADGVVSRIQDTINIGTNKNIKDNFNLDLSSGTASYQYPILIPQGQANFSPSLSLAYSSNNKDIGGIFGYGWNLNGLSYIERSSRRGADSLYKSDNLEFEMNLRASSSHLLSTHGVNSIIGSYGSETESDFLKINYTADNKWEIIDKLGVKYLFGLTSSSILKDTSIGTHIYRWYLDEIIDTNGNKIKFEYFSDSIGNKIYLDKVKYNFTKQDNGVGGFNYIENDKTAVIEFVREVNAGGTYSYASGFKIANNYSVSKINIKLGTQLIKEYALTQQNAELGNIRLLKNVKLKAYSESGSFNEETSSFEYQENPLKWDYRSDWIWPASGGAGNPAGCSMDNPNEKWLDVNGDGFMDYARSCAGTSQNCDGISNFVKINNGNGTWTTLTGASFDQWGLPYFSGLTGYDGVYIQDFNGDGFQDIYHYWEFPASDIKSKTGFFLNNHGTGFTYNSLWKNEFGDFPLSDSSKFMDINGDGLVDSVTHEQGNLSGGCPGSQPVTVKINKGNGDWWDASYPDPNPFPTLGGTGVEEIFTADFNGDGLTDVYHNANGWSSGCSDKSRPGVFINQGDNTFKWDSAWSATPMIRTIGDYNNGYPTTPYRFFDINADNLTDIVYSHYDSASSFYAGVYLNKGNGSWQQITSTDSQFPKFNIPPFDGLSACALTPSTNYDGSKYAGTAFTSASYPPPLQQGLYLNNNDLNPVGFLLSKASDSRGAVASIKYEDSTHYKDASGNLSNSSLPFPIQTVKEITIDNGLGNLEKTTYEYQNGLYFKDSNNSFRKEFAGFGKVISLDSMGNKTINYFHQAETDANNANNSAMGEYQDHISKIGKPYRTENFDNAGNLYSKTISKWENYDLSNSRNFVKLTQKIEQSYDGNSSHKDKAETYTYDNTNGNLIGKIQYGEVIGADDGTFTDIGADKITSTISYASNSAANILGLPSQEIITDQSGAKIKESKYYYDNLSLGSADKGNQTREEKWKADAEYISAQKSYNSYGLVVSETDPRGKITSYAYDSYNLYPATITNALSQTTQYTYDYSFGKPKQVTDPNNFVFQTIYDGLERVIEEKQPDPITPATLVTKSSYIYTDTANAVSVKKIDYLDAVTSVDSYSYFDGLGRVIQTRQEAEDANNFSVKDFVYNNRGLLQKESLPYFGSGFARTTPSAVEGLYSVYTYDPLARITSTTNAVGTITNAYDDWKVTATDAKGISKDLYKDAYGNLIQVDERNGASIYTTTYTYDGVGNLTKITDALGNVRNFTYDGLGRRLTAEDLHSASDATFGVWTYTYDANGNLISQFDPKSQTINYTYDDLNRQLTEDYTGANGTEKTYVYDTCLNGIGRLCTVATSDYTESKEYNALGMVSGETKTINSTNYPTSYAYDWQGNNILLTNPDNSQVENIYNSTGQLEQVQRKESTDAGFSNIVTDFDYSPLEKITYQASANGSVTINTYNIEKLYRLTSKVTTIAGGVMAQDLAYTYDANGNITRIVDNSSTHSAKTVDYTYDSLNRLLTAVSINAANEQNYSETYSYDAIGNIASKNGVIYTYSGAGYANPHAVTSIGSVNYTYDNNGNLLSDGNMVNTWNYQNQLVQTSIPSPDQGTPVIAIFSPSAGDGSIYKTNSSWTTAHDALSGTSSSYTATSSYVRSGKNGSTSYLIQRAFLPFNTSSLPDNAAITSANLKVYVASKANYDNDGSDWVTVAQGAEASTTSLAVADYDTAGSVTNPIEGIDTAERKDITSVTTGQYLAFNLNSTGKSWISLTGSTKLALREGHDAINSAFVGASGKYNQLAVRTGEYAGTAYDPVLEVTYTLPPPTTAIGYAYDANGQRIKYSNGTTTTIYPSKEYNISGGIPTKHIFLPAIASAAAGAGDQLVGTISGSGVSAVAHTVATDHLTGSNVVTNSAGVVEELADYYPYGEVRLDEKAGSFSEQRKYAGHELDVDTGLSYMNARYYSGKMGRFVSQDPAFLAVGDNARLKQMTKVELERYLADPQLANSYSYAVNNPLKYTDPTGDFIDIALDVGFIGYDLYRMGSAAWNGNWSEVKSESANLGLDIGGAALPGITGLGMIRRAGEAAKMADKAVDAGRAVEKASEGGNYINKIDDIIPASRQNHILNGEASRTGNWLGGHKAGTGMGKPEFPSSWSDKQIFHNAADLATDPKSTWLKQPWNGNFLVSGVRDGVNMSTVIDKTGSFIVTAFPKIK